MRCVLDASLTVAWLLKVAGERNEDYAFDVLRCLRKPGGEVQVPATWALEIANVLTRCEAQAQLTEAQSEALLALLAALPIVVDGSTSAHALAETLQLARRYRLSSYDASYLELALRAGYPLATLDVALQKAAAKAGVKLFKVS